MRELPIVDKHDDGLTNIIAHLSRTTHNVSGEAWEITVRDTLSGERILQFAIDDENFSRLMAQRQAYAWRAEVTDVPTRVGKRRVRTTVKVQHEVIDKHISSAMKTRNADEWAANYALQHGLETTEAISIRSDKGGWWADFDRWEDA